jgi:hypothetical protein
MIKEFSIMMDKYPVNDSDSNSELFNRFIKNYDLYNYLDASPLSSSLSVDSFTNLSALDSIESKLLLKSKFLKKRLNNRFRSK